MGYKYPFKCRLVGPSLMAYQNMGYIVRHNSLLRGTSMNSEFQSAVANQSLPERSHINLLVFWEDLVEVAQEFHMLARRLKDD